MIEEFLINNNLKKMKIIVIGDIALDVYHKVNVNKISPEFPISILNSTSNTGDVYLGCSANVCMQMTNFNVDIFLLGFLDEETKKILNSKKINSDFSIQLRQGLIPRKNRFYENNFPLVRWDVEQSDYGLSSEDIKLLRDELYNNFLKIVSNTGSSVDMVVMSDYNKGVFSDDLIDKIIKKCNENNIPSIIDPKAPPLDKWKNCTYFKPNQLEAQKLTGRVENLEQANELQKVLNCKGLVVTQEGNGYFGKIENEFFQNKIFQNKIVVSRIGAGDAFLAILTICLSHGISFLKACNIAWIAGTKYVQNMYNKPLCPSDLIQNKIIMIPQILKERDYKLIMTNGCFDFGLTSAHVEFLQEAKSLGDKLVVAINSDASVCKLKSENRPIMSLEERMKVVAGLESVDFVVSFDEETPLELIKAIEPNLVVKGGDYKREDIVGYGIVPTMSSKLYEGKSTTEKLTQQLHQQRHQP